MVSYSKIRIKHFLFKCIFHVRLRDEQQKKLLRQEPQLPEAKSQHVKVSSEENHQGPKQEGKQTPVDVEVAYSHPVRLRLTFLECKTQWSFTFEQKEKVKVRAQEDAKRQQQDRDLQAQQEEEERLLRKKVGVRRKGVKGNV